MSSGDDQPNRLAADIVPTIKPFAPPASPERLRPMNIRNPVEFDEVPTRWRFRSRPVPGRRSFRISCIASDPEAWISFARAILALRPGTAGRWSPQERHCPSLARFPV